MPKGFWGQLTDPERDALSALGPIRHYLPGSPLCIEGDLAERLFVLLVGWVKVLAVTEHGHQRVLALRGPGDIVGEIAGETTGYRTATMEAIDKVQALVISYDRFNAFIDSRPRASRVYRREVTGRWRADVMTIRDLPVTNGAQRLARRLLELAERHGNAMNGAIHVAMPLSQEELGSLANTSRSTVTRAFGDWRLRGFIRTGPRLIVIHDVPSLTRIAGLENGARPGG